MPLSVVRVRHCLQTFDFKTLFIQELGWDRHAANLTVATDGKTFALQAIAEKRGMQVFECPANADAFPDYPLRRRIERQVGKSAHEHLVIYTDAGKTLQTWQWLKREQGRPLACREHTFHKTQPGDALIQKLQHLAVGLEEEENLTLVDVTRRTKQAFDVDRITKRFYDRFKTEHAAFLKFIKGITAIGDREWYASLMLNRLMFIYFIQKKGFLDDDLDYLRNRLKKMREGKGKGKFLTFYRYFLRRLFHDGLGNPERTPELEELLGKIPFVNGGLFDVHELEEANPEIEVPDDAFERLFGFFDTYQWHLDERPLRADNEINPDVLGYIFEKYINQKQMGAYYTKEDITGYIARNTVIAFLFDAAKKKCSIAFQPDSALWRLLRDDPDRYIYPVVLTGVDLPLPDDIAAGLNDVSKRQGWNRPAPAEFALPTETWREHVARRQRCHELRAKLKAGEIHAINDLITYNLDICQFAEDVIENCEGPELLRAFWHAIEKISVLDPTCGSGAFLFAALNILEPLYEACLERMQAFLDDLERSGARHHPEKFSDFRKTLDEVDRHPNRRYFILKSIIINNLYGVDIMEEAVEICKLRLFLKLVAQVDKVKHLEPLPDIDFNIRAGNTLVGFANLEGVKRSMKDDWVKLQNLPQIEEAAEIASRAFEMFRVMQTKHGMDAKKFSSAKVELRNRLDQLREELDRYLADEYVVNSEKPKEFQRWQESHQPFHWFAEFYGIMHFGGFDVIIGNPPYLERAKLGGRYRVVGYKTESCRDIYAWVVERATTLRKSTGCLGLIVPVSLASSGSFDVLRGIVSADSTLLWVSHFANRPGQLFAGAQNRLTILLSVKNSDEPQTFSTRYHRWDARGGEREPLFENMQYVKLDDLARGFHGLSPKVGVPEAASVLRKTMNLRHLGEFLRKQAAHQLYWVRVPGYFCQFFLEPPKARPEKGGPERIRGEVNSICLTSADQQRVVHAVLNSSTYHQFFCAYTDGRHINSSDVTDFPVNLDAVSKPTSDALVKLSGKLEKAMRDNTSHWRKSGLLIESVDSRQTKAILDEIDRVLAKHYGFTDEELDFIINYDVKYRMGQDGSADEGQE